MVKIVLLFLFFGVAQGFLGGISSSPFLGSIWGSSTSSPVVVPLKLVNNKIVGIITVGKPKSGQEQEQEFSVYFNTLSSNVWLPSVALCDTQDCEGMPFRTFNGDKSQDYVKGERLVRLKNENEMLIGSIISRDQIKFGTGKTIVVTDQEFLEVTVMSKVSIGYDGSFGLGLVSDPRANEAPVLTMKKQFKLEPVFGFYFHTIPNDAEEGRLILGGEDEKLMKPETLRGYDVVKEKDAYAGWIIPIEKVVVIYRDGTRKDLKLSVNKATPFPSQDHITLPSADGIKVNQMMFEQADFQRMTVFFKCTVDWKSLPDVGFVIGGHEYILTPEDYVRDYGGEGCMAAIGMPQEKTVILGRPFMRKFYTRFHFGKGQVQFAEAVQVHP